MVRNVLTLTFFSLRMGGSWLAGERRQANSGMHWGVTPPNRERWGERGRHLAGGVRGLCAIEETLRCALGPAPSTLSAPPARPPRFELGGLILLPFPLLCVCLQLVRFERFGRAVVKELKYS